MTTITLQKFLSNHNLSLPTGLSELPEIQINNPQIEVTNLSSISAGIEFKDLSNLGIPVPFFHMLPAGNIQVTIVLQEASIEIVFNPSGFGISIENQQLLSIEQEEIVYFYQKGSLLWDINVLYLLKWKMSGIRMRFKKWKLIGLTNHSTLELTRTILIQY